MNPASACRLAGRTAFIISAASGIVPPSSLFSAAAQPSNPAPTSSLHAPGGGMAARPPRWLQPGDVVEVGFDGIGTLRNPVSAEV